MFLREPCNVTFRVALVPCQVRMFRRFLHFAWLSSYELREKGGKEGKERSCADRLRQELSRVSICLPRSSRRSQAQGVRLTSSSSGRMQCDLSIEHLQSNNPDVCIESRSPRLTDLV